MQANTTNTTNTTLSILMEKKCNKTHPDIQKARDLPATQMEQGQMPSDSQIQQSGQLYLDVK